MNVRLVTHQSAGYYAEVIEVALRRLSEHRRSLISPGRLLLFAPDLAMRHGFKVRLHTELRCRGIREADSLPFARFHVFTQLV